jgi:hypothetical protein
MRLVMDDSDHVWEAWPLGGRSKDRFGWSTVTFSSPMHGLRKGKLRASFDDATDEELKECLRFSEVQG